MIGVLKDRHLHAAQHAAECAAPTHITRAGRLAQVLAAR